jgi:hypothetical protein
MTRFALPSALLGLAQDMIIKGWQPVWCPARQSGSFTPLPGCTGSAPYPTALPQPQTAHKLAFRPPPDVLLLDVDHYDDKHGMDTMDRAEDWLGMLPLTYRVTSRGAANPSGRYMFRIPADLVVTDSSLYQFADEDGATHIEMVRTGHRFSWAPGDYHYKNDELIVCYNEYGEECELPDVSEVPELPAKWVEYFRNPPVPQRHEAYTRPSDGAEWWLSQADTSLGSDGELAGFAYNMLLSRVPYEEIWEQWTRVARSDNPDWLWERKDFERHLSARAEQKAGAVLAHQDEEASWIDNVPGMTPEARQEILDRAKKEYENPRELRALVEPEIPVDEEASEELQALTPPPFAYKPPTIAELAEQKIKDNPKYNDIYYREAAKQVVQRDVAKLFASEFQGFEDISNQEDPAPPSLFQVTGKDSVASAVITEGTVSVLSAKRASGKTWVTALISAQVMTAGGHVMWLDFERQPKGLAQKLRLIGVPAHLTAGQLHYSSILPPVDVLVSTVAMYQVTTGKPVLLVVDAFRTLQGSVVPGSNANDGDAVEQVYIDYITPAVNAGATVVLLDHIAKNGDGSTFGSERKESAADYVIRLEKTEPFSKTRPGYASLTCAKDRYGVIAEGDPVGYLWVPGDKSKSGKSIEDYPYVPELRNWSPAETAELEAVEISEKGKREAAVTQVVKDNPLAYGPRDLGRHVQQVYPDLFTSAKAATDFASRMRIEGKLLKEQGSNGKYELPAVAATQAVSVPLIENLSDPE